MENKIRKRNKIEDCLLLIIWLNLDIVEYPINIQLSEVVDYLCYNLKLMDKVKKILY